MEVFLGPVRATASTLGNRRSFLPMLISEVHVHVYCGLVVAGSSRWTSTDTTTFHWANFWNGFVSAKPTNVPTNCASRRLPATSVGKTSTLHIVLFVQSRAFCINSVLFAVSCTAMVCFLSCSRNWITTFPTTRTGSLCGAGVASANRLVPVKYWPV